MPTKTPNNPFQLSPTPAPETMENEIRILRSLIRTTHTATRNGTIDLPTGTRTIARLSEALSALLRVQHTISPPINFEDQAIQEIDRMMRVLGSNPTPENDQPN
ncbi:MAG: hypothetical protein ABI670_17410 [Chloroflexota bacterium]